MSIEAIYARIPDVECKGLCQSACGPIGMTRKEFETIKEKVGDRVEGIPSGRQMFIVGKDLTCPLLNPDGKCSVYAQRPAICRLYGAIELMRCPHGCKPKKFLRDSQGRQILKDVDAEANR